MSELNEPHDATVVRPSIPQDHLEPRSLGAQVNTVLEQQSAWADKVAALQKALSICLRRMNVTAAEFTFAEMLAAEPASFKPNGHDGYIARSGW